MKVNQWLVMAGLAVGMIVSTGSLMAQDNQRGQGQGRRGPGGGGNFDPAEMQQRMLEGIRNQMAVTDDAEWKIISDRVTKVMDARRQVGFGGGAGFMRGGRPGGDNEPNRGGDQERRGGFRGGEPNVEAEALRKAIDSKASATELKTAMQKYRDSRKARQAALESAQADLQKVLSVQQEAVAVMMGLIN
jgi:hypothetical protein